MLFVEDSLRSRDSRLPKIIVDYTIDNNVLLLKVLIGRSFQYSPYIVTTEAWYRDLVEYWIADKHQRKRFRGVAEYWEQLPQHKPAACAFGIFDAMIWDLGVMMEKWPFQFAPFDLLDAMRSLSQKHSSEFVKSYRFSRSFSQSCFDGTRRLHPSRLPHSKFLRSDRKIVCNKLWRRTAANDPTQRREQSRAVRSALKKKVMALGMEANITVSEG